MSNSPVNKIKKEKFFDKRNDAEAFAVQSGLAVSDVKEKKSSAFLLPPGFFTSIKESATPFGKAICAYADAEWSGSLEAAWSDALVGAIAGVSADVCDRIDRANRRETSISQFIVEIEEQVKKASNSEVCISLDAGEVGNEDGTWGTSTSSGWMVDD
jgi:hypothetical protein